MYSSITHFLTHISSTPILFLAIICILMIANGFSNFPSSQILYIGVGIFLGRVNPLFWFVVLIGALGNAIGNTVLTVLLRTKGIAVAIEYMQINKNAVALAQKKLEKHGLLFVGISKLLPGVKVLSPFLAAISGARYYVLLPIFYVSSLVWAVIFVLLGILFKHGEVILKLYSSLSLLIIICAVIGALLLWKKIIKVKIQNLREVYTEE